MGGMAAALERWPRVLSQREAFALSGAIAQRLREHMSESPGDPERRKRMQRALAEIANARADAVEMKPAFKGAWAKGRRC